MDLHRPSSRDEFKIAIICALALEHDAVEALLDEDYEEHGTSYGKAIGDKNAYTIGRFGKQHVVVAHMPGMGTISAAAVAANLNSSFPKVEVAFVVGVCGGMPLRGDQDEDVEIHLGDVIISTLVVQIDFGREYPNGFKRKKDSESILGRATPAVRAFVTKLSSKRIQRRLTEKTHAFSTQICSMQGFASAAYPGNQYDVLYAADYLHKHWEPGCEICDKCEKDADEVCDTATSSYCDTLGCQGMTAVDTQDARKPFVHFGRIACGNQVIKSGTYRNKLALQEKVIGFEMESAGTWEYVPTIVVKSVCDYADSHKSERWQKYCAATAAACTKAILEEWRNEDRQNPDLPHLPLQPAFPVHTTVTRPVNTLFTGRRADLQNLESTIRSVVGDRSQQGLCHIVISGMGGQGKSEICLQLAHQLRNLFWGVFWVDVSTPTLAENGFIGIAGRLGVKESSWEAARQELVNAKQPWLLVLDNADDPEVDYQPYFPASPFGVVILTSRNAECQQYATGTWVKLEGLGDDDAQDLLLRAARVPENQRELVLTDAQNVAQLLQSHPLALIQAGSYISHGHCSLREYSQVYEQQRKRLLAFRPTQATSRYSDVYTTFEASAEALKLSENAVARDALEVLPLLAIYGPNRLPVHLFEMAWKQAQFVTAGKVASDNLLDLTTWHLTHLPAVMQVEAEAWDRFRLVEALNKLKALSLVSLDSEGSSLNVSMHPLVHVWARDRLSIEQQHAYWVQAGCVMALSYGDRRGWGSHQRQLQPHLEAVASWPTGTAFGHSPKVDVCRILVRCGCLLRDIRSDAALLKLLDPLYDHLDLNRAIVAPQWLNIYELTAISCIDSGVIKRAIGLLEDIVKIREQTLAEAHPNRLASQQGLAVAYLVNMQFEDATRLLEHVVKIQEQTLAEAHPNRLVSQQVLAVCYWQVGDRETAVNLMRHVVNIEHQSLDVNHPHRLISEACLAKFTRQQQQQQQQTVGIVEDEPQADVSRNQRRES